MSRLNISNLFLDSKQPKEIVDFLDYIINPVVCLVRHIPFTQHYPVYWEFNFYKHGRYYQLTNVDLSIMKPYGITKEPMIIKECGSIWNEWMNYSLPLRQFNKLHLLIPIMKNITKIKSSCESRVVIDVEDNAECVILRLAENDDMKFEVENL